MLKPARHLKSCLEALKIENLISSASPKSRPGEGLRGTGAALGLVLSGTMFDLETIV